MKTIRSLLYAGICLWATTEAFLPISSKGSFSSIKLHATSSNAKQPLSWQESLELLLSPATSLSQRQVLFQDVVSRAPEIRKDVEDALREGNVDGLLTDGVKAVRRQLQEDIIPNLAAEPEQAAKILLEEIPKLAKSSFNNLPKNPKDLAEAMREAVSQLPTEARNVFLKTPEGLETPHYSVLAVTDEYEIREYDSYTVAYTDVGPQSTGPVLGSPQNTGGAFNTLASYLFGYNENRENLAMTTPVEIRIEGEEDPNYEMRFIVGSKYTTETAPRPSDPRVRLTTTPKERLAAKKFPGFATEGEVRRQLISLLMALEKDGVEIVNPSKYRVFQYNPPYTLPWLRQNEILVEVRGLPPVSSLREDRLIVVEGNDSVQAVEDGFKDAAAGVRQGLRDFTDGVQLGVESGVEDVKRGVDKGVKKAVKGMPEDVKENVDDALEGVQDALGEVDSRVEKGKERVQDAVEEVDSRVEDGRDLPKKEDDGIPSD